MAEYDASMNKAHAGFVAEICKPAGSQNVGRRPPPANPCTGSRYEEHGHFINMTDKAVTKVACGFYTTASGKVWVTQNFSR